MKTHVPFGLRCVFNNTALQEESSKSCGHFVIYYIIERIFNEDLDFHELLNDIFSNDKSMNEGIVNDFLKSL